MDKIEINAELGLLYVEKHFNEDVGGSEIEISLLDGGELHDRSVWLKKNQVEELIHFLISQLAKMD